MIEPIESLSFSMQANRGVYALLLGSGLSRAAEIPTGWEITLDLVRKLAGVCGEECGPDPESWFQAKFGQAPDYSQLLDELAKTRSERQQLLRPYFEANEQEREEGKKQPTAAHRAIAQLAAQGFIRVIVTTNFDRLLETALAETGVAATVLSSPDDVKGALPLIHTPCCVLKVHGDYLDTRIRNTPSELEKYPKEFDHLLDRIFDEFGLVVCGWSASWDDALRAAICRTPSRRFTTFWAARGEPGEQAQRLIDHRRAQVIPVDDADSFFQKVQHNVESIEEFSKPHPLSTAAAVASLKRYLPEPRFKIQLADLIDETVGRVIEDTSGPDFDLKNPQPTTETVTARIRKYEAVCSTLIALAAEGGRWGEVEHCELWQRALRRLGKAPLMSGTSPWLTMRIYPGMLLLYALGLGAVEAGRLEFLGHIFSTVVRHRNNDRAPVVQALAPAQMESHYLPLNDWMLKILRPHTKRIIPDDDRYTTNFVKLEMLMSMNSVYRRSPAWVGQTRGVFLYFETAGYVLQEITDSIANHHDESPFVRADIFGQTSEECLQHMDDLKQRISESVISRFS